VRCFLCGTDWIHKCDFDQLSLQRVKTLTLQLLVLTALFTVDLFQLVTYYMPNVLISKPNGVLDDVSLYGLIHNGPGTHLTSNLFVIGSYFVLGKGCQRLKLA
jgi:hypothetical protein